MTAKPAKDKIADEEYYRALKSQKQIYKSSKPGSAAAIARSRFDPVEPPSPSKAEFSQLSRRNGHTNPNTIKYVLNQVEPDVAIQMVELPQQTLYLIDKVVRQKAMQGPIGVDNSEVINLEMERDLKKK